MATQDEFLGSTQQEWSQNIRNGYARAFILFAMHDNGVFDALRGGQKKTCAELARECKINAHLLSGSLNYLLYGDKIIGRDGGDGGCYFLTECGEEWLFSDTVTTFCYGAVGAYHSTLANLSPCLREEMKYGVDFERPGRYLAIGSKLTGRGSYPAVLNQFREIGAKRIVDLGCGTAGVLIAFCGEDKSLQGVGVDLVPESVAQAKHEIAESGMADRITAHVGDIMKPETYKEKIGDVDCFHSMMAMHEFLRDGEQGVVDILAGMKRAFPGKHMVISEWSPPTGDEYPEMPWEDRPHLLFSYYVIHYFTWQGLPSRSDVWGRIFENAGVELVNMHAGENIPPGAQHGTQYSRRMAQYTIRF